MLLVWILSDHVATVVSMAVNVATIRFVLSGTLPGGEIFSTGFRTFAIGDLLPATLSAALDSVATFLASAAAAPIRQALVTPFAYTRLDAYGYPANSNAATSQATKSINVVGQGTQVHPNQVAICATILTGLAGRRHKGRMYFPANGVALGNNGNMATPSPQDLATAVARLLESPNANAIPVVASPTAGTASLVSAVRVDSRPDVIRGRANKQGGQSSASAAVRQP